MKKDMKRVLVAAGIGVLLAVGVAVAGTEFIDVIRMEHQQAFAERKKGIVMLTHKKHVEEYKINCGQCHHDKDGKPLALKAGDAVQPCLECHAKGKADKNALSALAPAERKKEAMKFYFNAVHEKCEGCHEKVNVEKAGDKNKGPAPVTCVKCHLKAEGDKG